MARSNSISFLKTTRTALDSQAGAGNLIVGEPYFITDEGRFAVATSTTAFQTFAKQGEAETAVSSRLVPNGGTSGQILSRKADGSLGWIAAPSGGGSSGPISQYDLPQSGAIASSYDAPSNIAVDSRGRIRTIKAGSKRSAFRGTWTALTDTAVYNFEDNTLPAIFGVQSSGAFYNAPDSGAGTNSALALRNSAVSEDPPYAFNCYASGTNTLTIRFALFGPSTDKMFVVMVDGAPDRIITAESSAFESYTKVLSAGMHQIALYFMDQSNDPSTGVAVSQITMPIETYAFGDVVSYDGKKWLCTKAYTSQTPGTGDEWNEIGSSYTLATDTAPSLNAMLNLQGNIIKSVVPTGGHQYIRTQSAVSAGDQSLTLMTRNFADTSDLAGIRINSTNNTNGTIYYGANTHVIQKAGLGSFTNIYTLPSTQPTSAGMVPTSTSSATTAMTWTLPAASVGFYAGGLLAASEVIGRVHAAQTFTIVAANCKVTSDTAATASAVVTIKKAGTAIGTATFAAGATTATISITTTAVTKNDLITFHAPDAQDATLANVSGTISN